MPFPRFVYGGVFTGQSGGHGDRNIGVSLIEAAHQLEVSTQALEKLLVVGQEGHPVGLGVVKGDEQVIEVQILNPQMQGFEQARTAAVEETGEEVRRTVQFIQDAEAFVVVEVGLDIGAFLRAGGVQIVERNTKHVLVEEQERGKGLVLSGGRDLLLGDEMGEEGFDPFGRLRTNLRCAHGAGVVQLMEADIALVPMNISLFGAIGIAAEADGLTQAVGEFLF